MNDRISENAIWEEGITYEPDDTSLPEPTPTSGGGSLPQMMICYNCNNVIPGDSLFCPWCRTELYTQCPKCGNKYSSQYPSCTQCGTNKQEYLLKQEKQAEMRRKAQERRGEQRRIEQERRQRILEEIERSREERKRLEAEESKQIKQSIEYQETYDSLMYLKRHMKNDRLWREIVGSIIMVSGLLLFITLPIYLIYLFKDSISVLGFICLALSPMLMIPISVNISDKRKKQKLADKDNTKREKYLWEKLTKHMSISSKISESMIKRLIVRKNLDWTNLETEIIKAYKSEHRGKHS